MQRAVRDEVLGRVFGALQSILVARLALGALLAPPLINLIGTRASLIVVGALLPLLALLLWRAAARRSTCARTIPPSAIELLRANPIFAPLPPPTVEHLAAKLVPRSRSARATPSSARATTATASISSRTGAARSSIDGEKVRDAWPGETFGEIALLRDVPRTATVTAVEDTKLLALERDDFIAAVTGHAPSREAADAVIGARLGAPSRESASA